MSYPMYWTIEAHPECATLYLAGCVTVVGLLRALRECGALPSSVWLLRVDCTAAEPLDAGTELVLAHGLRRWRGARSGITNVSGEGAPRSARVEVGTRHTHWRTLAGARGVAVARF